jgi:DNA-binding NarL/FixJ family response regulator
VALVSNQISERLRILLVALGANACVSEHASCIDLVTAVRYADEGKGMWTSSGDENSAAIPVGALTRREQEVFELVQRDLSNREIARELQISPGTVEAHRKRIRRKLGLGRRWIPMG